MFQEFVKPLELIAVIGDSLYGAEQSFRDGGRADGFRKGQDSLLNLRGEAQHARDLGDPCTGNALHAGEFGLVGDLAGLQEGLPLDCLPEEFDHPGYPGFLGRLGDTSPGRYGA